MTKKLLPLTMLVALMLFAGCASAPKMSMEERFDTIMQESAEMKYADMKSIAESEMTLIAPDFPEPMIISANTIQDAKIDYSDTENIKMHQILTMESMGQTLDMEAYYYDNYIYQEFQGVKVTSEIIPSELTELAKDLQPMVMQSSDMETLTMEIIDNNYVFTYKLSQEALQNYHELIDSITESLNLGSEVENMEISFDYFEGTLVATKDNEIKEFTSNGVLNMSVETIHISAKIESTNIYNSYNIPLTIELPNLEEYVEIPTAE